MKYTSYLEYKSAFIKKHSKADWTTDTSPMDKDGRYVKYYMFSDGAVLTEVNRPVYETVKTQVEVKGITVEIEKEIKLFETEAWNTDDANSVKFYELF